MSKTNEKDIDTYIHNSAEKARPLMEELRQIIKSTVPLAEEEIGWNVPIYKFHGILAGYDTYENHDYVSFGIDSLESKDREKLEEKGYETTKTTIRIRFDQEVPSKIIEELLIRQAKMNEEKVS